MRQFFLYIAAVFSILFLMYVYREDSQQVSDRTTIKVYASGSFISNWGPGPELKKVFEANTGLKITYIEMADPGVTLQKIAIAPEESGGDVVLGLDQFDIVRVSDKVLWKDISALNSNIQSSSLKYDEFQKATQSKNFIPYDWSAIAFVKRTETKNNPTTLRDLLNSELKSKVAFQDPRTSSPGLQFLLWVANSMSEEEAIQFLKDISVHAHSFSPSWSTAYGLFKNKNVDYVLSYVTSPVYHLVEERDGNYQAMAFKEGLPLQIEFAGILSSCKNCDSANKFISFIQTKEAQKIIMNKNYMLPVDKSVVEGTAFDTLNVYKLIDFKLYTKEEINKWLRIWSDIRKNEG
jgi:thiamine transport system substrate-binding protein